MRYFLVGVCALSLGAALGCGAEAGAPGQEEAAAEVTSELIRPSGPCDVLANAGHTCAAAHSTARALYKSYSGNLYQVKRADGATQNVGVIAASGVANSASQTNFCAGSTCTISIIYDQSPNGNHLTPAPGGGAKTTPDNPASATALESTLAGHAIYGVLIKQGIGYRKLVGNGLAVGDQAETEYMVTSQRNLLSGCCFEYGNAETSAHDDGNGAAEAVYFGGGVIWGTGSGGKPGPWVMADLENGLYAGWQNNGDQNISTNTPLKFNFVTALIVGDVASKNSGKGRFALYGGDATAGTVKTMYDGIRPNKAGYVPMEKQGSIVLGVGGDNSASGGGEWYEGVLASGAASVSTINAVQANIVAAGYGG